MNKPKTLKQPVSHALKKCISFFYEVGALRSKKRAWAEPIGADMANIAEHTFRTQAIAAYLAKLEGEDPKEAVWMAFFHDFGESRGRDTTPHQRSYVDVNENLALAHTFEGTALQDEAIASYAAYKARQIRISQIVKDADILDTVLELLELKATGHSYPKTREVKWQIAEKRKKYTTQNARDIHDAMLAKGAPNRWSYFLEGPSTFKTGKYGQ